MRGIITVIVTGFMAMLVFGIFAPAVLEPIVDVVANDPVVDDHAVDGAGMGDRLLTVILVWGPLLFIAAALVWAVRWYLRREQVGRTMR